MSRLQKKCFVASVAMHSLLLAAVFFGAAFLAPPELKRAMPVINMVKLPDKYTDSSELGGGVPPSAAPATLPRETPVTPPPVPPPPPVVETPRPAPPPEPVVSRPPPVEPKRAPKPTDHVVPKSAPKDTKAKTPPPETTTKKATTEKQQPKVDISKQKMVSRNPKDTQDRADEERRKQQDAADKAAKAKAEKLARIGDALGNLRENLSTGISVETVGGDGAAFLNYGQVVVGVYQNAWIIPQDLPDNNDSVVQVSVTIARDGKVVRANIVRPSSNSTVNKSVKRALDNVKSIAPFPEGAKDEERTFNIDFNLKAKRLTG